MSAKLALALARKFKPEKIEWRNGVATEKIIIRAKSEDVDKLLDFLGNHGYEPSRLTIKGEVAHVEFVKDKS